MSHVDSPESCHTFQSVLLPHISVAQRTENATLCESLLLHNSGAGDSPESRHTFDCTASHVNMSQISGYVCLTAVLPGYSVVVCCSVLLVNMSQTCCYVCLTAVLPAYNWVMCV